MNYELIYVPLQAKNSGLFPFYGHGLPLTYRFT